MKKCNKRTIVALLLLFTTLLVACAGDAKDTEPAQTTASSDVTTANDGFKLPLKENIGGTFVIYNCFSSSASLFTTVTMVSEDIIGEVINDAIYKRNMAIESNYGVSIREYPVEVNKQLATVKNAINAGDGSFDMAMVSLENAYLLSLEGLSYDLNKIKNLDLEKKWWDQRSNFQHSMGDSLYYTLGDFDTTHYDSVRCIFFNKKLQEQNRIPDLYSIVKEGQWTIDKMHELGQGITADTNGDGKYDANDIYGFIGVPSTSLSALLSGSNSDYINMGDDGYPYVNFLDERFVNVYNKILDHMFSGNFFYQGATKNVEVTDLFVNGHGLFLLTTVGMAKTLRGMDTDFGILPLPKYDTAQKEYRCNAPNPYAAIIPHNSADPERAGFILEALSYYSNMYLRPAYFDVMLNGQVSRDSQSGEMLDIIFSNITYNVRFETAVTYSTEINKMMTSNNRSINSYIASVKDIIQADLNKYIEKIGKNS